MAVSLDSTGQPVDLNAVPANNQTKQAGVASSPWEEDVNLPETPPKNKPTIIGSLDGSNVEGGIVEKPAEFNVPKDIDEKVGQKIPAQNFTSQTPKPVVNQGGVAPSAKALSEAPKPPADQNIQVPIPKTPAEIAGPSSSQDKPAEQQPIQPPANPISLKPDLPISENTNNNTPSQTDAIASVLSKAKTDSMPKDGQAVISRQSLISRLNILRSSPRLSLIIGLVLLPIVLVLVTELGVFSFGLEKVYSAIGLERLWGGLPKSPEAAIARSAVAMRSHLNFKAAGTLTLTVDKSSKSSITKPLVSQAGAPLKWARKDERIAPVLKAILTQSVNDGAYSYDGYSSDSGTAIDLTTPGDTANTPSNASSDTSTGTSSGSTSSDTTSTDITTDTSTTPGSSGETTDTTSGTTTENQSAYPGYQYQGSETKEVVADFSSMFSSEGNSSTFQIKRATGDSEVDVKNIGDSLWVKSGSFIKFNQSASANQWSEYKIDTLSEKKVQSDIFSLNTKAGFSTKGTRLGNEKVGKSRTYHYKLDSLEIGNSLTSIGISSEMVQSITGDVWIGVRDKLIKKVNLQITAPSSSSVSVIHVQAEFSDYDIKNSVESPDKNVIVKPADKLTGDEKRKADLAGISQALESYKSSNGSYPTSAGLAKLSVPDNALSRSIVPEFMAQLPADDKSTSGWYYGYQSDGKTYTLSARMENQADPEARQAGSVFLYYVYNK